MRVLHCYRTYFPDRPGGLQEAIRQTCISTEKIGIKNEVFCLSPSPSPRIVDRPECRVIRSRSWCAPASCDIGSINALGEFSQLIKNADILHYQFPWPFADILHLAAKPSIPAVLTYHSDIVRQKWLGKMYRPLMWKMLRRVDRIVATSSAYARTSSVLNHPSIKNKVRVIPLGINEETYVKLVDDKILSSVGLSSSEPYFLFIGVMRYYKGLKFLLEAAKGLDARVVIAGSGPEEAKLKKFAEEAQISNVVFAGQVTDSEKVSLIKNCRALVLPSHLRSEAFGMVQVEAQIFSRPLISCEIGTGTSYVNLDGESGLVVPPSSSSSLHAAMRQLLRDDKLFSRLGAGGRSRYERLFSGDALGQAHRSLYSELVG